MHHATAGEVTGHRPTRSAAVDEGSTTLKRALVNNRDCNPLSTDRKSYATNFMPDAQSTDFPKGRLLYPNRDDT